MHYLNPINIGALLFGICLPIWLYALPNMLMVTILTVSALICILLRPHKVITALACITLGLAFMAYHVNNYLAHQFPEKLEGQVLTIVGTISSVVEDGPGDKFRFLFTVAAPATWLIELTWEQPNLQLLPGQSWSLAVKLKRPRSYANPGSFDSEKYYFQRRVSAIGYVQASNENHKIATGVVNQLANKLRQKMLDHLLEHLGPRQYLGVIIALIIGSKTKLSPDQWQVLQNSGTAHLLAISGMHIGLIYSLALFLLRRLLNMVAASCGSLLVAALYSLLAGLSISTQRSLLMLALVLCSVIYKRKVSAIQRFSLALLGVLLWDPFVVLSAGFWLSFAAVGGLLYGFCGHAQYHSRKFNIWLWLRPQLLITFVLLPFTLLFFAQSPTIALIVNLLAIPWVCCLVLPLCFIGVIFVFINQTLGSALLYLAERSFACLWPLLKWSSALPIYFWRPPECYLILYLTCAICGSIWLFIPQGLPGRLWGLICLMPLFFVRSSSIPYGELHFTLLDVGQGLSAVLRTQNHVLVYDTGAKTRSGFDLGSRVVAPYLQTLGVKAIDKLLISHVDNDHIGGAEGLLARISANEIMLNSDQYLQTYSLSSCLAGQHWFWDGVEFTVLHPQDVTKHRKRNDDSCVLMVQAGTQKILLTGDIETKSEKSLLLNYGAELKANILLVPHHGSKTSSSLEFIQQVQPQFALIPVGYKNQYGHPKVEVLARYSEEGIMILRTELDGAISFRVGGPSLQPMCYRHEARRFWHLR